MRTVDEDGALAARAAAGDPEAFRMLVTRHRESAYAVCRRWTGDAHEAEDLLQEAFLRAHRGLPGFRSEASFRTWFYRIVANVCRSWSRAKRPVPVGDDLPDAPAPEASSDRLEALGRAVEALPEKQRAVVTLRYFAGLEFDEIAAALEITPEAARMNLSLARRRLAETAKG